MTVKMERGRGKKIISCGIQLSGNIVAAADLEKVGFAAVGNWGTKQQQKQKQGLAPYV